MSLARLRACICCEGAFVFLSVCLCECAHHTLPTEACVQAARRAWVRVALGSTSSFPPASPPSVSRARPAAGSWATLNSAAQPQLHLTSSHTSKPRRVDLAAPDQPVGIQAQKGGQSAPPLKQLHPPSLGQPGAPPTQQRKISWENTQRHFPHSRYPFLLPSRAPGLRGSVLGGSLRVQGAWLSRSTGQHPFPCFLENSIFL